MSHVHVQNPVCHSGVWVRVQVWGRRGGLGHLPAPGRAQVACLPGEALPGVHSCWQDCQARLFQARHPFTGPVPVPPSAFPSSCQTAFGFEISIYLVCQSTLAGSAWSLLMQRKSCWLGMLAASKVFVHVVCHPVLLARQCLPLMNTLLDGS